jgi:hypothetical protein
MGHSTRAAASANLITATYFDQPPGRAFRSIILPVRGSSPPANAQRV